jgi:penicillin amidase
MSRRALLLTLALALAPAAGVRCPPPPPTPPDGTFLLPGLAHEVRVVTDRFGTRHVFAVDDVDLARVQGWLHARDRLFQMDLTRREVEGSRAELLGIGPGGSVLDGDIQNRTIGLRRAAVRSLALLEPREAEILQAFADGVNAWIDEAERTGALPPEYAQLELTRVRRWEPADTLAIGKGIAASLSLDIDVFATLDLDAFVQAGAAASPSFDGAALFFDLRRAAPMDPASSVPDAEGSFPFLTARAPGFEAGRLHRLAALARGFAERSAASSLVAFARARPESTIGSNHWGVTAERSATGHPILANDPHLGLDMPSTFYETHLVVEDDPFEGPMNVNGITFPGVPAVILGQNETITWGATTNPMDVTDTFADRLWRGNPGCPVTLCIESGGELHPVDVELVGYLANQPGDGVPDNVRPAQVPFESGFVFSVPFRSFGPVINVEDPSIILGTPGSTTALVLQFTGFHATREVHTFRAWNRARDLQAFEDGLRSFDFGSQNWLYADRDGNLAYFTSAELPLRADLEAGQVAGVPPYFIRDGVSGDANWVPDPARSQGQAIPFAVLPEDEMPHVVNPRNGFVANANNDPAGTTLDNDPLNQRRPGKPSAIYYLNGGYDEGLRAGRITQLVRDHLASGRKVSVDDMKRWQSNTQQRDAELMLPALLAAWEHAGRAGAPAELVARRQDAASAEAIGRLAAWDFSTPTGIPEGYDAHDRDGERVAFETAKEKSAAVAATLYNVWRAKLIRSVVDARLAAIGAPGVGAGDALKALHHVLTRVPYTGVLSGSGIDLIPAPAQLAPADRRDLALLGALRSALDALAGPSFADAFGGSTDPADYLWGRLHRITFAHPLGGAFSVPPANGFADLAPALPGLSRDGGYEVVNASGFSAKADSQNAFRFSGGPVRRYVGIAGAGVFPGAQVVGWNVIPGGSSGVPGNPLYTAQLPMWLTADQHPVEMFESEAVRGALATELFRSP